MRKHCYIHPLFANLDTLFALGFAAAAVVWVDVPHWPHRGFTEFSVLRITLLSAAFSSGFAIVWRQCFTVRFKDASEDR